MFWGLITILVHAFHYCSMYFGIALLSVLSKKTVELWHFEDSKSDYGSELLEKFSVLLSRNPCVHAQVGDVVRLSGLYRSFMGAKRRPCLSLTVSGHRPEIAWSKSSNVSF